MLVLVYLISRKEEEELINEFGKDYEEYKEKGADVGTRTRM